MTVATPVKGLQTFDESLDFGVPFAEATVEGTVIHNVKLLGKVSKNGRIYSARALTDAALLYPGVRIMVDHPSMSEERDHGSVRPFDVLIGQVLNARVMGDSVRGDIQLLEGEPRTPKVLSLARDMPALAGFSHRAEGTITVDDEGIEHVESLEQVFAVELVTQPATTDGLFESKSDTTPTEEPEMKIEELTLAQLKAGRSDLVESLAAEVTDAMKGDTVVTDLQTELKDMKEELATEKTRADKADAATKLREHTDMVAKKIAKAGLHKSVVTEQFLKDLNKADDEAAVVAMVEDRKAMAKQIEGGLIEAADAVDGDKGPQSDARNVDESLTKPPKKGEPKPVTDEVLVEAAKILF